MRSSRLVLLVFVAAWLAACSGGDSDTEASAFDQSGTTQAAGDAADAVAPSEPGEVVPRRFEVDGMVVWTRSAFDRLSERATLVRFTSTLIDSGEGLELCLGGVQDSLPPQCSGPVVEGLDPSGWTETVADVTWGERTVTVEWPAEDGRLTLVNDEPAQSWVSIEDERPTGLPADCEDIANFVDRDTVSFYAADNPDRTAGGRSVNNGAVVVLAVVEEHLEDVRAELTTTDAEPCLESVKYSQVELSAAQDRLRIEGLYLPDGPVLSSGSGNSLNRLTIDVAVADRQTIDMITEVFDDLGMLYLTGYGEILAGS